MVEGMAEELIFLTEDEEKALIELYRVHLVRVDRTEFPAERDLIFMRLIERICLKARIQMKDVKIRDSKGGVLWQERWPVDMARTQEDS